MRKLKTSDIPAFCRCMKKIGIKDNIEAIAKESQNKQDAFTKGFDLIYGIFDLATEQEGEKHLYEFLAGPLEMSAEEIANLDIGEFIMLAKQLAEENDLLSFFRYAGKSTK